MIVQIFALLKIWFLSYLVVMQILYMVLMHALLTSITYLLEIDVHAVPYNKNYNVTDRFWSELLQEWI